MASPTLSPRADERLRETRALLARYLDPMAGWDAARDARLREHLREDAACARAYDEAVVRHRLMTGSHPDLPSGFERRRMAAAIMPETTPAPWFSAGRARLFAVAGALAAAVLAAVILLPRVTADPTGDDRLQARGMGAITMPERLVGVGISGVDAADTEYEIIASGHATLGDWLRVTYTNERPELGYLFLVGVQPERPAAERITWLAPLPDEGQSVAIDVARLSALPFEIRLGARHVAGPWQILALFTERPLTVDEVTRALDSTTLERLPSEWPEVLRQRLTLSPRAVVQRLETRIERGIPSLEDRP